MLRVCASQFQGQTTADYNNGAVLKYVLPRTTRLKGIHVTWNSSNLGEDLTARHQCQNYYGEDKWFAGHRDGSAGLANPNTADINSMFIFLTNQNWMTDWHL